MKAAKVLGLILCVLFLAGCAGTKCQSKAPVAKPVAVAAPIAAPVETVATPEPASLQEEEPGMEKVPLAVTK